LCVFEKHSQIEVCPKSFGRKIHLLYTSVADAGYYGVLQERESVDMEIELSEINIQINQISGYKCMEIDRRNAADKKENTQQRTVGEEKVRMLQKRDAERNRYRQMTGEAKARMLQKKRDAKRNRYRQITGEEKARILQKKRDAERNRYSQMTGEEKVKMLHKNRNAKRNKYNQMTSEEKARMLMKKRVAARNRYTRMTDKEKARMLQKKKEARQIRLSLIDRNTKAMIIQKKKDVHQGQHTEMKCQEGAEVLQKERYSEQNRYMEMRNEDKGMIPEEMKETQQSRLKNDSVYVASGLSCEENTPIEPVWGETRENSTFNCNPEICSELVNSILTESMYVVCDYCQAKMWDGKPCGVCCSNREVHLQPLEGPPELLKTFPSDSNYFLEHMRMYNSDLQMTSLGASRKVCHGNFMPTFKIQGQVYHLAELLLQSPEVEL
jgi:hypothetical protein